MCAGSMEIYSWHKKAFDDGVVRLTVWNPPHVFCFLVCRRVVYRLRWFFYVYKRLMLVHSFRLVSFLCWWSADSFIVTNLGVFIDGRLNFVCQVTKVCSKVYATLYRLCLLKFLTPNRVRLKFCKALLLPYFFYCDAVFSRLSSVYKQTTASCF
jgi:hypothetical protein